MENISTKCLIIGSGPAGYTAAIYASRANLSPILFEGMQPGGQLTTTSEIENFPGYPEGIGGFEMMDELRQQAERFGTDVRDGEITAVDFSERPFTATTDDGTAIRRDFMELKRCFELLQPYFGPRFDTLSMGMSHDYPLAVECGSTMVRVGSLIFGRRGLKKPVL